MMNVTDVTIEQMVILFVFVIVLLLIAPEYVRLMVVALTFTIIMMLVMASAKPPATQPAEAKSPAVKPKVRNVTRIDPDDFIEATPADMYAEIEQADRPDPNNSPADEYNPYGWMSNTKYTSCYSPPATEINNCNTGSYLAFDEAHARYAALRQRDKKALDGVVTKNANYFKRHFGRELAESENERWWGNDEY